MLLENIKMLEQRPFENPQQGNFLFILLRNHMKQDAR